MAGLAFFSTKDVEWNDLSVYISGVKVRKVAHFECGVKTSKEYLHGAGAQPLSIQSGNKEYPFMISLYKADVDAIWAAAITAGGEDITDVSFDIQGSFQPQGGRPLATLNVSGCEVTEFMYKISQNDKKMQVDLPGLAMGLTML